MRFFGDLRQVFTDMWQRIHEQPRVEHPKGVKPNKRTPTPYVNYMHNYRLLRRKKLAARTKV